MEKDSARTMCGKQLCLTILVCLLLGCFPGNRTEAKEAALVLTFRNQESMLPYDQDTNTWYLPVSEIGLEALKDVYLQGNCLYDNCENAANTDPDTETGIHLYGTEHLAETGKLVIGWKNDVAVGHDSDGGDVWYFDGSPDSDLDRTEQTTNLVLTTVPVLELQTGDGSFPGDEDTAGAMRLLQANPAGVCSAVQSYMEIHVRGNTSRRYPKKATGSV